jgi:hypothetical protein
MRGSPLLRAAVALFGLLALGFPLWRLTHAAEAPVEQAQPAPAVQAKAIHLQLDFTLPPKKIQVLHLGKEVWSEEAPATEIERDMPIDYPDQGVDLQFHIEWPDDAPLAAMRAKLTDPAGDTHEKSLWGRGAVDDVLTFP